MREREASLDDVLVAIQDQTRIFLALSEKYPTKSERVRRLSDLGIPPSRVAILLGMPLRDVTSAVSKAKRRTNATGSEAESVALNPDGNDGDQA